MNVAALDNARQTLRRVSESGVLLIKGGGLAKTGQLPQYSTVPHSSLTAVSDFVANRKFSPSEPPNPLTSDEQRLMERLLANMSKSRARIADARRRARLGTGRLKQLFTASGLWG